MGLGATYDVDLRLIAKLVGDFLLVIMKLFSLGAFVLSQCTRWTDGQTDRQTDRQRLIGRPRLHSCCAVKTTTSDFQSTFAHSASVLGENKFNYH